MLILALLIPTALFVAWFGWNLGPYNANDSVKQKVVVYPGATDAAISNLLYGRGLLKSTAVYRLYLRLSGQRGRMQAGTYEIAPSMSVKDIVQTFSSGAVVTANLTLLPGKRLGELRGAMLEAGFSARDVERALDPALYTGHPALVDKPEGDNLEGYLHADTFQFTGSTPLSSIIRSSLDSTAALFTARIRKGLAEQGLSLHQGVILASIIEREVSEARVKPRVAQVFLSRLRAGMPLGSDVTAYYGASLEGRREAVAVDTPYNTRIHKGLPPGPISNISAGSLAAVAAPADTDYLYFVAGDDGQTYFSRTEEEHEQMKELHCQVLCLLD